MKSLFRLCLLLLVCSFALGQGQAPPTGYVQPIALAGLGSNGFYSINVDATGALIVNPTVGLSAQIGGYVQPYAPVAMDSGGVWHYLQVDGTGALKTTGGGGGGSSAFSALTSSTNTTAAMVVGTGASLTTSGSGSITASAVAVGGITGLGTGVGTFLATPSSANLAAAVTDESGTGALLFAGGNIGAATGTSLGLGTTPSVAGVLNFANNSAIYWKNAAGTADLRGFLYDNTNTISIGSGGTVDTQAPKQIVLSASNAQSLTIDGTNSRIIMGSANPLTWAGDMILTRSAAAVLQLGGANAASPVNQTLRTQGSRGGTDTNTAGASLTIESGAGTGTATPPNVLIAIPVATTTGSVQQVYATVATFGPTGQTLASGMTLNLTDTAANTDFTLKNTTAAVVGTSQGSPVLAFCGRDFHGSADVEGCGTLSYLAGNGNDAARTITIGATGTSTGVVTTSIPGGLLFSGTTAIGGAINGIYLNSAGLILTQGSTNVASIRSSSNTGIMVAAGSGYTFSSGNVTIQSTPDLFLFRAAAASLQLGAPDAASPVNQTFRTQGSRGGTDTNIAGSSLTIEPGAGTGNATPSNVLIAVPTAQASGTTQQTYTTVATFTPNGVAVGGAGLSGTPTIALGNNTALGIWSHGTNIVDLVGPTGACLNQSTFVLFCAGSGGGGAWNVASTGAMLAASSYSLTTTGVISGGTFTNTATSGATASALPASCETAGAPTTLATGASTTDTGLNCLPANAIIDSVVYRITTTITTAANFTIGDATTAARFCTTQSTLTSGTTGVCFVQADQTGAPGPRQVAAAAVRVTLNANPGAGAIRLIVFYHTWVAPTS